MDVKALLVECWRLTESYGRKPSIIGTIKMARAAGASFDEHEARTLLRPFLQKSTQFSPSSNGVHPNPTQPSVLIHPDSTQEKLGAPISKLGSRAHNKVLLVTKPIPSPSGDGTTGSAESDPEWVKTLRREIAAIDHLTLASLTVEQRLSLGRYHAYRFEHYVASEIKNKNRGVKHVGPIADIGRTERYGDVTVSEYRGYLQQLMLSSGALIRSPWLLKGAIEDE